MQGNSNNLKQLNSVNLAAERGRPYLLGLSNVWDSLHLSQVSRLFLCEVTYG